MTLNDMIDAENFEPENFFNVGSFKISRQRATQDGQPLVRISWFEARALLEQASAQYGKEFFIPTSNEWETARKYVQQADAADGRSVMDGIENAFLSGGTDWTDSLVVFADAWGSVHKDIRAIPRRMRHSNGVYLIDHPTIRKGRIVQGDVKDVTNLVPPYEGKSCGGFVQGYDEETGLPTKIGAEPDGRFNNSRCVICHNMEDHPLRYGSIIRSLPISTDPRLREVRPLTEEELKLARHSFVVGQALDSRGSHEHEHFARQNPKPYTGFFICTR